MPDVPDTDGLRDLDARLWGLTITAAARVIKAAQPADDSTGGVADGG
jgi:hypothetical protein